MKDLNVVNSGFLFAWALILSFCLMSCADDQSAIQIKDGSEFEVENRADNPNQPPEIPDSEEWILTESTKGEMDWREIKQWYLEDLLQRNNDPSVPNLKSITVEILILNSNFLEEAEKEDLLFFASEIVNDDRVRGNPMAIAKILKTAAGEKPTMNGVYPELEIMKLAATAEAKYVDGANSAREKIKGDYKKSLGVLAGLHRNRWGASQLKEVNQ
jgi:hypothetical protein